MKVEMWSDHLSMRQFILLSKIIGRLTKSVIFSCYLTAYNCFRGKRPPDKTHIGEFPRTDEGLNDITLL